MMTPELLAKVERLRPIAGGLGVPLATFAIAWVKEQPGVDCVLLGARTPEQLAETLRAADVALPPDALAAVDAVFPPGEGR